MKLKKFVKEGELVSALCLSSRSELALLSNTLHDLLREGDVLLVINHSKERSCDKWLAKETGYLNPKLTDKENDFLLALLLNDSVKNVCIDLKLSKPTYYARKNALLSRLKLKDEEELRQWALTHLVS